VIQCGSGHGTRGFGGAGTLIAQYALVSALIILGIGLICSMIARIMIITAAFRISWKWGIGVLLPFGPMAFRMTFPDDARPARPFQLVALPCFLFFILMGSGLPSISLRKAPAASPDPTAHVQGFAMEKPASAKSSNPVASTVTTGPGVDERRASNAKELERLALQEKELKLRKRDLLRSDVQGQAAYERDLADYKAAFAKANAEKTTLATAK
jgi:hypothetical protein